MSARPTVVLITTGGTIACRRGPGGGLSPALEGPTLCAHLEEVGVAVDVVVKAWANVLGAALSPDDLCTIALAAVGELEKPEVQGVVITAGTGILEEGSYLCSLLNTTGKAVVWTGAQRSSDAFDADGPRNIIDSVRVASSPEARGTGALICFNQEVHSARDVSKEHKSNVATFTSHELGIVARADDDCVMFVRRAPSRPVYSLDARLETNVDLIKVVSGSDERFFRASQAAGARGIVVEGFPGVGIVSPGARRGMLEAIDRGIVVVLGARSPRGRVRPVYGGEIGARDLEACGVLLCNDLAPVKARLLLMVLLSRRIDPHALPAALLAG